MGTLPSQIGPYRVVRKLGEGGMGAVYEAVHSVIQRRVAIKILHTDTGQSHESVQRFLNEARAANLIGHPGLVQITDFGQLPDGAGYLVMEYLAGETLSDRIQASGGTLPPEETVHIGIQLASALSACHQKGIIHRDLKPGNVMLVPDPAMATGERCKVLDFGLAKLSAGLEAALVKTQSAAVLGTPLYMSPEQCEGAGRVDAKTDVYALGCMLYEMQAGRPPFVGEGAGQVLGQHLFKEPQPLGTLAPASPAALSTLIARLLIKEKEKRPSMRETEKALEALAHKLPAPRRREPPEPSGAATADTVPGVALGLASTLGQGLGEPASLPPTKRPVPLRIAGAALVLLLCALFVGWRVAVPRPVTQDTGAQMAPVSTQPVTTRIDSQPAGAQILDPASGAVLGVTPWQRQATPQAGTQHLTVRLSGHTDQSVTVQLGSDEHASVTLVPKPSSATASKPSSAAQTKKTPVLKRIATPIKKLAGSIAHTFRKKPAPKPAHKRRAH